MGLNPTHVAPDLIGGRAVFGGADGELGAGDIFRLTRRHIGSRLRLVRGGWVYIMANVYRGRMYVGVTANLAERMFAHRTGRGSATVREKGLTRLVWAEHCPDIVDAIAHEKRLKRWRRQWKFALIERANPDWDDLYATLG